MLEARGSVEAPKLLSREDGRATVLSIRDARRTFSILSEVSSKRMAAITDKRLKACNRVIDEDPDITVEVTAIFKSHLLKTHALPKNGPPW